MNLYLRYFLLALNNLMQQEKQVAFEHTLEMSVLLHDIGFNDHLPNYRYFSFMELGRAQFWHKSRLNWSGRYTRRVIAEQSIKYINEIRPLEKIQIKTHVTGWCDKYVSYRQEFYSGEKLKATATVKEALFRGKKRIDPARLFSDLSIEYNAVVNE